MPPWVETAISVVAVLFGAGGFIRWWLAESSKTRLQLEFEKLKSDADARKDVYALVEKISDGKMDAISEKQTRIEEILKNQTTILERLSSLSERVLEYHAPWDGTTDRRTSERRDPGGGH